MNRIINNILAFVFLSLLSTSVVYAKSYQREANICIREPVTCAIYAESRGEPLKGQYAVAFVVYNRINDARFPKTTKGVVWQKGQFSWTKKRVKIRDKKSFEQARRIAAEVAALHADPQQYARRDPTNGAIYFNGKHVKTKHYKRNSRNVVKVGNHVFYGKVAKR